MGAAGHIRVGVGGWVFEPWRGSFYPDKLRQADELKYMSSHVTVIEINATYYGSQKPDSWKKWAGETPDDFVFTVKGNRFCTNRKELGGARESIEKFFGQGLGVLGPKLGPVFWQFAPTKKFDAEDFEAFLALLPRSLDGLPLRHAVEVRHDSFRTPEFIALLRKYETPVVFADHATYPAIPDVTGGFVYARLQTGSDDVPTAYPPAELDVWAKRLKSWAGGEAPTDLERVDGPSPAPAGPKDVFAFIIHEGKVRAPAAAMEILKRLGPPHARS